MESVWEKEINGPKFDPVSGDIRTDVLIIGGGMAGILCGHMLQKAGIDCVIAEADTICGRVTKNTTAKVTCHHGAVFDDMIRRYGTEKAALYLRANAEAVVKYRQLAGMVDCDFADTVSFVFSRDDRKKMEKEVAALQKLGYGATFKEDLSLPFSIAGAVSMPGQGQFHPLKFAFGLARKLRIFEHTRVLNLTSTGVKTERGEIKAEKVIVTTHFPFLNKYGLYFLKMYQHRSYVLALRGAPLLRGMYVDADEKGFSFRSYDDLLLLGGGGHRTGKQGGGWRELSDFAKQQYPRAATVCRFATQDCKTLDDIPYIGQYSPRTPNLYVATGFNKWGMTSSMVAADILTDLIRGRKNEYAAVFSPARSIWHKQLLLNAGESVLGLVMPTAPRCPHLGCALKYNRQEHTWDCGCHGSRFAADGELLDNPATRDIHLK